eukprot:8051503-Karenia_brevis.AAC.1
MARWKGMRPIPNRVRDELMCALMLIPLMRCDARVPVSGLVTCSDASLSGGAVSKSVRLSHIGMECLANARKDVSFRSMDEVVLISLFDGIGGALRALDLAGVSVQTVATSETNADAARVTKYAWPHVIEWGDITKIGAEEILGLKQKAPNARHVLITAG